VVFVDEDTAWLVVEGREQVVADAHTLPNGWWAVVDVEGCEG
jgi:hypothetical protein